MAVRWMSAIRTMERLSRNVLPAVDGSADLLCEAVKQRTHEALLGEMPRMPGVAMSNFPTLLVPANWISTAGPVFVSLQSIPAHRFAFAAAAPGRKWHRPCISLGLERVPNAGLNSLQIHRPGHALGNQQGATTEIAHSGKQPGTVVPARRGD
jgi:hypothetical protein